MIRAYSLTPLPLDARTTSSVTRITRFPPAVPESRPARSRRAISRPISSMGWRTLERVGAVEVAIVESSNPTTAMSWGTRLRCRRRVSSAPAALDDQGSALVEAVRERIFPMQRHHEHAVDVAGGQVALQPGLVAR